MEESARDVKGEGQVGMKVWRSMRANEDVRTRENYRFEVVGSIELVMSASVVWGWDLGRRERNSESCVEHKGGS
jgi:hypothetical protein